MSVDKLPSGAYRIRVSAGKHTDGRRRVVTRTLPPGASRVDAERVELELKLQTGRTTGEGELFTVAELIEAGSNRATNAAHPPPSTSTEG